jgi:hypothetical protein
MIKSRTIITIDEKILKVLESHKFQDWYLTGRFESYITGEFPRDDPRQPTKDQILEEIRNMFGV